jgi:hypothetical protein
VSSFLLAARLNLVLIAFLFLDTPKEPLQRLPFFDFLSPFPIEKLSFTGAIIAKGLKITKSWSIFVPSFQAIYEINPVTMARATLEIVELLRKTAEKLQISEDYQWGHMGSCNCGFLAQQITHLTKEQIHRTAMEKHGDWTEQLNDYCPTSGIKMDSLISSVLDFGFDTQDLKHLEWLSDPVILRSFPVYERNFSRNVKTDVIIYIRRWADLIEASVLSEIDISTITDRKAVHISSSL